MALAAGITHAQHATANTNNGTTANVTGSIGFTPYCQPLSRRVTDGSVCVEDIDYRTARGLDKSVLRVYIEL